MQYEIKDETLISLLKEEYFFLHNRVEHLDQIGVKVKQWGVTVGLSGIGIAYWKVTPMLLIVSVLSAFIFWIMEASWKSYQLANFTRIIEIESFFSGIDDAIFPLQSNQKWKEGMGIYSGLNGIFNFLKIAFYKSVMLPHVLTAAIGVILWFFYPPIRIP